MLRNKTWRGLTDDSLLGVRRQSEGSDCMPLVSGYQRWLQAVAVTIHVPVHKSTYCIVT